MDHDPTATPEPPVHETLRELLLDPDVREQLAGLLAEEIESRRERPSLWRRLRPWLAGAASALVTALAFFLPSLQEQWDRLQSRRVIQSYVQLGRDFMREGRYRLAEETFGKAFDLSESRRLDIEEERLAARVARIEEDPAWGASPEGLAESDFLYLLHMQEGSGPAARTARARTLNSYGTYLDAEGRPAEAESAFVASIRLDPSVASPWVHLGNLRSDRGDAGAADSLYRRALGLDPGSVSALYDLALLRAQAGRLAEADSLLARAAALAPADPDILRERADVLERAGRAPEAAALRERLARLPPPRPPVKPRPADESSG